MLDQLIGPGVQGLMGLTLLVTMAVALLVTRRTHR